MDRGIKRQLIRHAYLKRAAHPQEVYVTKSSFSLEGDPTGKKTFAYESGWSDVQVTLLRIPLSRLITLNQDDPIWDEGVKSGVLIGDSLNAFSQPQSWTPSDTLAVLRHTENAAHQVLFNARNSWSGLVQAAYSDDLPLYCMSEIILSKPNSYAAYPIPNLYAELVKVKSLVEKPPRKVR